MKLYDTIFNRAIGLFFALFVQVVVVHAQYDFGFVLDTEVAHPANEGEIAAESQSFITIEQNWASTDRKQKALLQARLLNFSYEFEKNRYQSSEFYPADFYFEFLPSSQRLTVGYQHIFLIEGFDSVGMELLNPKNDNISFFADADKKFYTVPAINYRWIGDAVTFHVFATLKHRSDEQFNVVTNQIQNFNPLLQFEEIPNSELSKKNDLGLRLQTNVKAFDLSFSLLRTFEKSNPVTFDLTELKIKQMSDPFTSYLLSFSGDLSGWVFRFDYLQNSDRKTTLSNFEYIPLSYRNINFGIEHDFVFSSLIALNFSQSKISVSENQEPLFRKASIEDFYVRLSKKFSDDFETELLFLQRVSDSGRAVHLKVIHPMSPEFNVKAGIEMFDGPTDSQFKQAKDMSRFYVGLNSTVF